MPLLLPECGCWRLSRAPGAASFAFSPSRSKSQESLMSPTNTSIPALDGEGDIPAYVARPDADSSRAIIVIPEIFGVNAGIRQKCDDRSEEHTSELQSLMRTSYAVFCLNNK